MWLSYYWIRYGVVNCPGCFCLCSEVAGIGFYSPMTLHRTTGEQKMDSSRSGNCEKTWAETLMKLDNFQTISAFQNWILYCRSFRHHWHTWKKKKLKETKLIENMNNPGTFLFLNKLTRGLYWPSGIAYFNEMLANRKYMENQNKTSVFQWKVLLRILKYCW